MSAPSFSSFPPSFSSFPDPDAGPSRAGSPPDTKGDDRKSHPKVKKHKDKESSKSKRHEREKVSSHRHKSKPERKPDHSCDLEYDERIKEGEDSRRKRGDPSQPSRASSPPLYFTDKKGDALNVTYGGLHTGSIPKYHVVARGRQILGLPRGWTVVHWSGKGVEVGAGTRRKMPSLADSRSRKLLQSAPTRRLLASDQKYKYDEVEGFLRIRSGKARSEDQTYRSITRRSVNPDSDSSGSSESEREDDLTSDDEADATPLTALQIKLKELEQQISADPSNVHTWLSLLWYSLSNVPITSKNANRARTDIAVSVLARALSAHPKNRNSTPLRLKYIKAGEEVWHESKLRSEWENALQEVNDVDVWIAWFDWRLRKGERGIEGMMQDASRVLKSLQHDEVGQLRMIWRVAVALRDAGYVERAAAVFQAQAELTFEVPQSMYGLPLEHQLDALEEFWESEAPRLGEPGAQGWASWIASGRPDCAPANSRSRAPSVDSGDTDPYRRWSAEELRSDKDNFLPSRSVDDVDDPYATILFSDIRPLLCNLTSQKTKHAFRLIWISFLGLHIPGFAASLSPRPSESMDDRWAYDAFANEHKLNAILPRDNKRHLITADSIAGVLVGRERAYSSEFGPVKNWGYDIIDPLDSLLDSNGRGKGAFWDQQDVAGVDSELIRRVFKACRLGGVDGKDAEWDALALAFEAAQSIKSALKLSKSYLSMAKDSLAHWANHARLERLRGRPAAARTVYSNVLIAAMPANARRPALHCLWWDWAQMEWLAGDTDATLQVILKSVDMQGSGGIVVLRCKRALEDKIKSINDPQLWKEKQALICLRALADLLTSGPLAALTVFDEYLLGLEAPSPGSHAHESLNIASLVMLYHYGYTLRNPMAPGLLRDRVHSVVDHYPGNTFGIRLLLEVEKGQSVWGRVRSLLSEETHEGKDKDMARRLMEIWISLGWEKGKWEEEKERIRNALGFAVESDRTRGSAILWRIAIEFEFRNEDWQRARNLVFRAIGECPLVKELYLLAFGPLRRAFSPQELNGFAETMAERGIRMRKGLDEVLEGWVAPAREMRGRGDDYGDEDIEHRADELRRLMPYH